MTLCVTCMTVGKYQCDCGCMLAPALWRPCLSLFNDGIVFWVCDRNSGTRTAGGRVFLQPCYVCFFNPRLDSWCWPEQAVCRHFLYTKAIYVLYQCRLKLNSICIGMIPLQKHFTYHSAKETWEKSAQLGTGRSTFDDIDSSEHTPFMLTSQTLYSTSHELVLSHVKLTAFALAFTAVSLYGGIWKAHFN